MHRTPCTASYSESTKGVLCGIFRPVCTLTHYSPLTLPHSHYPHCTTLARTTHSHYPYSLTSTALTRTVLTHTTLTHTTLIYPYLSHSHSLTSVRIYPHPHYNSRTQHPSIHPTDPQFVSLPYPTSETQQRVRCSTCLKHICCKKPITHP